MILNRHFFLFFIFSILALTAFAQKSILRGYVFDKNGGQPIPYANIIIRTMDDVQWKKQNPTSNVQRPTSDIGTTADVNGFYQMSNVPTGNFSVIVTSIGYDSVVVSLTFSENGIQNRSFYLNEGDKNLATVEVSSQREIARETPRVRRPDRERPADGRLRSAAWWRRRWAPLCWLPRRGSRHHGRKPDQGRRAGTAWQHHSDRRDPKEDGEVVARRS